MPRERGIRLFTVHVRRGAPDVQDPGWNSHSKLNCIAACIQVRCLPRWAANAFSCPRHLHRFAIGLHGLPSSPAVAQDSHPRTIGWLRLAARC